MPTHNNVIMHGKQRTYGGGQRGWRAVLYAPTGRYTSYRVMFKAQNEAGDWTWQTRAATTEAEGRVLFRQVERALDVVEPAPATQQLQRQRTIRALGEEYLADSRARGKEARTLEQRESRLNAHILPTIGDLQVVKWRLEHSRTVMEKAAVTVRSPRGREDLRGQLSAMRRLAHRLGWLDRSIDPLDGLELPAGDHLQGTGSKYIAPYLRPETRQVNAMARGADLLCKEGSDEPLLTRTPLFGTQIRVAGYGGLRLGEQLALRAIDISFDDGWVLVNGSWVTPRKQEGRGYRKAVKNRVLHEVPLPQSLLIDELLPRIKQLLDLSESTSLNEVVRVQQAERDRRSEAARELGDPTIHWYNLPVDPADEQWIFIDTATGVPTRPEALNNRWHRVRRWVNEHDPDNAWPRAIVYRNLRHHAATRWFHQELGEEWETVAMYLGDKLTTVLAHYVRPGDEARKSTVQKLTNY